MSALVAPLYVSTQGPGATEHDGTQSPVLFERQRFTVPVEKC